MPDHLPRGITRLAFDAVERITDIVEAMHLNISSMPWILGKPREGRTSGITGFVYSNIRLINGGLRETLDALLAQLGAAPLEDKSSAGREAWIAALNGVLGDYLAASQNPLALRMCFRHEGRVLEPGTDALARALPEARGKVLVVVHGLCMSDLQWRRNGHDHAAEVAKDLGYTPVYLRYNSGRHVSTNGRELADMLEALISRWAVPVEELVILVHSMGGLVTRSACHYAKEAGHGWLAHLSKIIFLGTPHHGAPLERGGNWIETLIAISPYSAPLARLAMLRSAGVTDLRYGSVLEDDWQDRDRFEPTADARRIVPLPENVECYAVAATMGLREGDLKDRLLGDGLVPLRSALGQHRETDRMLRFAESHTCYGTNHLGLLDSREVYEQIHRWLTPLDGGNAHAGFE
jgi:pimeloyl-ACP methyl ester carboxylesterase